MQIFSPVHNVEAFLPIFQLYILLQLLLHSNITKNFPTGLKIFCIFDTLLIFFNFFKARYVLQHQFFEHWAFSRSHSLKSKLHFSNEIQIMTLYEREPALHWGDAACFGIQLGWACCKRSRLYSNQVSWLSTTVGSDANWHRSSCKAQLHQSPDVSLWVPVRLEGAWVVRAGLVADGDDAQHCLTLCRRKQPKVSNVWKGKEKLTLWP